MSELSSFDTADEGAVYPRDEIWDALREVEDPELPISLVDMGLIIRVRREDGHITIVLTYTMMGCPAMDMIENDVRARLGTIAGVESIDIEVVWDPVWTKARLTSEGRRALLMSGVSV
jgi:metal-sulfur cluster biosynthetic enzyme